MFLDFLFDAFKVLDFNCAAVQRSPVSRVEVAGVNEFGD